MALDAWLLLSTDDDKLAYNIQNDRVYSRNTNKSELFTRLNSNWKDCLPHVLQYAPVSLLHPDLPGQVQHAIHQSLLEVFEMIKEKMCSFNNNHYQCKKGKGVVGSSPSQISTLADEKGKTFHDYRRWY